MDLIFERVNSSQNNQIREIFEILKDSGTHMYREHGLSHWSNEYPISLVKDNCDSKDVFIVSDAKTGLYVHTFQLDLSNTSSASSMQLKSKNKKEGLAIIEKFATSPKFSGKGIGTKSMDFILDYCRKIGVSKIQLDVYTKSVHAIRFYLNRGFIKVGKKATRRFEVFILEKII